jgi:hypothetical protein
MSSASEATRVTHVVHIPIAVGLRVDLLVFIRGGPAHACLVGLGGIKAKLEALRVHLMVPKKTKRVRVV